MSDTQSCLKSKTALLDLKVVPKLFVDEPINVTQNFYDSAELSHTASVT